MENPDKANLPDMVVIMGPTASGKTKVAVALANLLNGEIISADSRQVYKHMNIGTGKDLQEYKVGNNQIPFHLIDILEPGDQYNVHQFQQDFRHSFETIQQNDHLPILCGGTGLYIESVLKNRSFTSVPVNKELRSQLQELDKEKLTLIFQNEPSSYDLLADLSSRKRLIRAIEIKNWLKLNPYELSEQDTGVPFTYKLYCINPPVELRRERISRRLYDRLDEGMVEEVEQLLNKGVTKESLIYYGLEYKYITLYCLGEIQKDEMIRKLQTEIHRYAKRQMTFFRHMEKQGILIHWIDGLLDSSQILDQILDDLKLEEI